MFDIVAFIARVAVFVYMLHLSLLGRTVRQFLPLVAGATVGWLRVYSFSSHTFFVTADPRKQE